MKYKTLIPILLIAFVGASWFSALKGTNTKTDSYKDLLKLADESFEKELYQQAYGYYEEAFQMEESKKIENKILESYRAFDKEEKTSETYSAYLKALEKACERFPKEEQYWEEAIEANIEGSKYEAAMSLCKKAEQENVKSDALSELKHQVLYSYKLGGNSCSAYYNAVNGYFVTRTGVSNARVKSDGSDYEILDESEVGSVGDDNIYLCKDEEGKVRFVDLDGIIRGKVNLELSEFGVYSEGYCSAKYRDRYCFIDLDGNILIDNLQYAGCFQNGKAVIRDAEGKWALIDQEGKVCSDYFEEIKVDYIGRYLFGENVIVKKNGIYKLYNKSLKKEIKSLDIDEIDIPVETGIAAYCKDGKWGFINSEGETEIEPQYENAKSFSGGFAGVSKAGKWGLINSENQLIVDYQFYEVGYVSDQGACYVSDVVEFYQLMIFNFAKELNI